MSNFVALNVRNVDYANVIGDANDTEESGTIMGLLKGIYHRMLSHKMWVYDVDDMYNFNGANLYWGDFVNEGLYLSLTTTDSISVVGLPAQIYIANRVYKCSREGNSITGFEEITLDNNILINNKRTNQKYFYDGINLLCITIGREYFGNSKRSSGGEIFNDYVNNIASGSKSHAEGHSNQATGNYSHAEGRGGIASGQESHSGGLYTIANSKCMTAVGYCNTDDGVTNNIKNRLFVVGNGLVTGNSANLVFTRSDAFEVYSSGEVKINSTLADTTPKLTIGSSKSIIGTTTASSDAEHTGDNILATKYYVDTAISGGSGPINKYYCPIATITLKNTDNHQTVSIPSSLTIEKINGNLYVMNIIGFNKNEEITLTGNLGITNISFTIGNVDYTAGAYQVLRAIGSYILTWPNQTTIGYLIKDYNALSEYQCSFFQGGRGIYITTVTCPTATFYMEINNLIIDTVTPAL